nr:genetic suppressor element 1-like [Pelodiscus sinensis]|eukprot:XP_006132417.1 genetic suppressor element 1-like [Pelodiscus sinensis]
MAQAENERSKTVKRQGVKEAEQGTERERDREREREGEREPERRWTDRAVCACSFLKRFPRSLDRFSWHPEPRSKQASPAVQRPSYSQTTSWNRRTTFIRKDNRKSSVSSSLPPTPCSFSSQQAHRLPESL